MSRHAFGVESRSNLASTSDTVCMLWHVRPFINLFFTKKNSKKCITCWNSNNFTSWILHTRPYNFFSILLKMLGEFQIMFALSKFVWNLKNVPVFKFFEHKYKKCLGKLKKCFKLCLCFFEFILNSKILLFSIKCSCSKFCSLFFCVLTLKAWFFLNFLYNFMIMQIFVFYE